MKDKHEIIILSGLLLQFSYTILGGVLLGFMLDELLSKKIIFILVFLIVGLLASVINFVLIVMRIRRDLADENEDRKKND